MARARTSEFLCICVRVYVYVSLSAHIHVTYLLGGVVWSRQVARSEDSCVSMHMCACVCICIYVCTYSCDVLVGGSSVVKAGGEKRGHVYVCTCIWDMCILCIYVYVYMCIQMSVHIYVTYLFWGVV